MVWHSNDKYRRVVWQCNHKFKDKTRCKTPHLTEDEVKAAFIRLVNKLSTDREFYITELTAIKDRLGNTTALGKERRILDEQLGIDAKAVNDLIAQNAQVAQNQTEYNERYEALVSRYIILPEWIMLILKIFQRRTASDIVFRKHGRNGIFQGLN